MLTEICQYLHNWFDRNQVKFTGKFVIEGGVLQCEGLAEGQYFRIVGSLLNDGVHKTTDTLDDEEFVGSVWSMAIPKEVLAIATDIGKWKAKYEDVDSPAMSPYNSESFGGYSYSKGSAADGVNSWQKIFASRLNPWRKL